MARRWHEVWARMRSRTGEEDVRPDLDLEIFAVSHLQRCNHERFNHGRCTRDAREMYSRCTGDAREIHGRCAGERCDEESARSSHLV